VAEDHPPHLVGLNDEQFRAVSTTEGPLLILAGAGSGKTRVLTRRIAQLLHSGVDPENVLAVTFTRKAAQEMVERVTELVGEAASKVWVSTFHATCCRILRTDIEPLGWTRKFSIYDDDDQHRVIRGVLDDLGVDTERNEPRSVLGKIDYWKNRGYTPEKVVSELRDHPMSSHLRAWRAYDAQLKAADALDFNDLIGLVVRLWTEHPEMLDKSREKFKYVLVDEYQDTNVLQYRLLRMLTQVHRNLAVVGDDDQSIYAFRGADISNILNFEKDFPEATVIRLEQNYRSSGNILHVSNTVVAANERRIAKRLWTSAVIGRPVTFKVRDTPEEEARLVAQAARILHTTEGYAYSDMAVVYRTNATARPFEAALVENGLPYRIVGGRKFHERREVRDALSFLRIIVNPADDAAFLRVVNLPPRGIGARTLARLRDLATAAGQPLLDAARGVGTTTPGDRALRGFVAMHDELVVAARTLRPQEVLDLALERSGYTAALKQSSEEELARRRTRPGAPPLVTEAGERLQNLTALSREAARFQAPPDALSYADKLRAWLDSLSLAGQDEEIPDGGEITLMTVHNAKGLEYPVVFAVQLVEGQFPHARSLDEHEGIAEERRLAYVAFTRAKQRLIITRSRTSARMVGGRIERAPVAPSRFLFGLPTEACQGDLPLVEALDDEPSSAPTANPAPARAARRVGEPVDAHSLARGARVHHPRHGVGLVRDASDPDAILVRFSTRRRLVAANELRHVVE
jgi:DNA helicase-2/ATP-dependent DNA helicase PcrA